VERSNRNAQETWSIEGGQSEGILLYNCITNYGELIGHQRIVAMLFPGCRDGMYRFANWLVKTSATFRILFARAAFITSANCQWAQVLTVVQFGSA
jgi:hypothetical protein